MGGPVCPAISWRMTRSEGRSAGTGVGERFTGVGVAVGGAVVGDAVAAAVDEIDGAVGEGDGTLADWTHAAKRSAKAEIKPRVRRAPIGRV